jgi:hypothetical protein
MDRATRLFLAEVILDRTRDYTHDALNELFRAMEEIESNHELIPKLTAAEEAAVAAADAKLARGEALPELELKGPIEDFLPEPAEKILARLAALPEAERNQIIGVVALLIDINAPRPKLSAAHVADLRRTLKSTE